MWPKEGGEPIRGKVEERRGARVMRVEIIIGKRERRKRREEEEQEGGDVGRRGKRSSSLFSKDR